MVCCWYTHWSPANAIYGDTPQQIGEYQDALGLSRYVYAPQVAAITQAGNLYAYCVGNPVANVDPNGGIAITTIILIGSVVAGLIGAGITAYQSNKYTGQIDWAGTVVSGLSWFMLAYTFGMSAYEVYLSFCQYYGYTPVTEVNFKPSAAVESGSWMRVEYTITEKIESQMSKRGWNVELIDSTIQNPYTIRDAINKATGNPATAYYTVTGDYVVVDNLTGDIVQISKYGDTGWIPDNTIINPYYPGRD